MYTDISLNTILYGPPGTGKTYNTVNFAVAICERKPFEEVEKENYSDVLDRFNNLKKKGRIAFTTFHQSYGYEDFIEGIRPLTDENGNITYEVAKGVFKLFCENAELPQGADINHNADVYIVRLNLKGNGKDDLKKECFRDGEIRFDWPEDYIDGWMKWFSAMKPGDYVLSYHSQSKYIDGIGVVTDEEPCYDRSKTSFRWVRKVNWLVKDKIIDVFDANGGKYLSNFHVGRVPYMKLSALLELVGETKTGDNKPEFEAAWDKLALAASSSGNNYTFTRRSGTSLEGKYLSGDKFRVEWSGGTHNDLTKLSIMKQWMDTDSAREQTRVGGSRWLYDARQAVLDELKNYGLPEYHVMEEEPYVFIVDEINRGNLSKIFGELITLIEENKRTGAQEAMSAMLPYSGEPFSVPSNVYILGTMNTADRSIAIMDTALRRRFDFVEMQPNPDVLKGITVKSEDKELDVARMLQKINNRIEVLYDREHTIGHAFFMGLREDSSIEKLASIFQKNVLPLLQEYFYEDYQKIQMVLGDNGKESKYKFIVEEKVNQNLFRGLTDFDVPEMIYRIQAEAFSRIESYIQI